MKQPSADVLLVEDQPTDAELVLRALRAALPDERTMWLRDGERALEYLAQLQPGVGETLPRLVLLDLKLPRVGGAELLARLRSEERFRALPVVVLSSSADRADIASALGAGANGYVVKPVDIDELDATVGDIARYWLLRNRTADGG